ncbi:MAG: hypothetical protein J0H74_34870 [Chitinophagaceae bacterium]|nr:hypothetical protein [Chitinophagaceae bacterium]
MKFILLFISLFFHFILLGQVGSFNNAKDWKLYDIADENVFQYRLDTLKNFSYQLLSGDTMRSFMGDLSELPSNRPQVWMGAYVATFESGGVTRKIEISHYGGILYDESSKKHYKIAEKRIQEWLSYIRKSFMNIHMEPAIK